MFLSEIFDIPTKITTASEHGSFDGLRGQGLVIGISKALGAKTYLNPLGGKNLYSVEAFSEQQLKLMFIEHTPKAYPQKTYQASNHGQSGFAERLSVIDGIAETGIYSTELRIKSNFILSSE